MKQNDVHGGKSAGGIGFVGLLTIAFVVLKLCKVIDWSWWWVWSPIWISAGIVTLTLLISAIVIITVDKTRKHKKKGNNK